MFNGFLADSKRKIKHVLDNDIGKTELSLSGLGDGIRYVSFDIFDTLIVRDVSRPSDVFRIMEKRLRDPLFTEKRVRAEQTARTKSADHEVTIYDIYRSFEDISPEEAERYIRLELDTELLLCRPEGRMLRFYEQCRGNYPVILVSDMYLPGQLMEKLLAKCGITGYKRLYISCEAHKTKRSGELYGHVVSDLGIRADQLLHIGNDLVSDTIFARRNGLHALKIKPAASCLVCGAKAPSVTGGNSSLQMQVLYNFMKNTADDPCRRYDGAFGYGRETLGIILFGFCRWLMNKMREDGAEQVLFCGEDAALLKQAFDALGYAKTISSCTGKQMQYTDKKTALAAVTACDIMLEASGNMEIVRGYCIIAEQKCPTDGPSVESYRVSDDKAEHERLAELFRCIRDNTHPSADQLRQGALSLLCDAQKSCIGRWRYLSSGNAFYFLRSAVNPGRRSIL